MIPIIVRFSKSVGCSIQIHSSCNIRTSIFKRERICILYYPGLLLKYGQVNKYIWAAPRGP